METWLIFVLIVVYLAIGLGLAKFLSLKDFTFVSDAFDLAVVVFSWPFFFILLFLFIVLLLPIHILRLCLIPLGQLIARIIRVDLVSENDC